MAKYIIVLRSHESYVWLEQRRIYMPLTMHGFPLQNMVSMWSIRSPYYQNEVGWLSSSWDKVLKATPVADGDLITGAKRNLMAIALGLIYSDFCEIAWDELSRRERGDCGDWARLLGITDEALLKIYDSNEALREQFVREDILDDYVFDDAILFLANSARTKVFDILCPDFDRFPDLIEEMCAIKDVNELPEISDKVAGWFYEKCWQLLPYC
jgi:hypothetical protein